MPQWPRVSVSRRAASARSGLRLVMPRTVCVVVTPLMVRWRVNSNPCFSPAQFWCLVRTLVVRKVRFSKRPCPLLVCVASLAAGTGTGKPSGGKSGRLRPCLSFIGQTGTDIDFQTRLIVFDEEDIVAPLFNDLGTQVTLAKHGVAQDD